MDALKERILKDGRVLPGHILKVDSFLNHQMDIAFLDEIAREFFRIFGDLPITKVVTVEASGIGIAVAWDRHMKKVGGLRFHIVEVKKACSGM